MLNFIGLGLEQSPTLKALEVMRTCDAIFIEQYTSPLTNAGLVSELERSSPELRGKFRPVKREFVEDGRQIIELSKSGNAALLSSGDSLVATTHQELRERAIRAGAKTRVIHGSSILSAIAGELGLHSYNFGRTVTMTEEPMQYTAYNTIYQNLLRGLHTTILLQWDESRNFFLSPLDAISRLLDAEKDVAYGMLEPSTLVLIASRIGTEASSVKASEIGKLDQLGEMGAPPHTLVIPGRLHFTEVDALSAVTGLDRGIFVDNSRNVKKISSRMLEKYSRKTLSALQRARRAAEESMQRKMKEGADDDEGDGDGYPKFAEVFENVECYTQDAIRFLNEGRDELAVLSMGYAEGLLDSLRFAGILEFEW